MNKTITILQTSDLHGYIYPRSYATMKEEKIGLAQISALIKDNRDEHTILIDSGDTIQGSPFTYYLSKELQKTHPMSTLMNHLKYDYVTIGNHEFNYGLKYLDSYLSNLDAKILNCNIVKNNKPFYGVPYDIKEINGITVGIIGVTTHYIPNWEQPDTIKGISFIDAFTALKETVKTVRPLCDCLIVNYHGGFERDLQTHELNVEDTGENQGFKMLKEIDGIDLLLTGHQHRFLTGELFGTHYVQPGYNGSNLSKTTITITDKNKLEIQTKLLNPSSIDKEITNLVDDLENQTNKYLDTPVGSTSLDLLINNQMDARIHKHPLVSFINHVQMQYTNSDIASCSLGNQVSGFNKNISIRDVISTYIYPNTLVVKKVTGKDLLLGLEKTAEFFEVENDKIVVNEKFKNPKVQLYAYDMYDGIDYEIHLKEPVGNRIKNLTFKGKPIEKTDTFRVAMNNYRASGGGDYLFYKNAETIKDTQTEILELLIDYIVKEKELDINHKENIKFIY